MDFNREPHVPASNPASASSATSASAARRGRSQGNNWGRLGVVFCVVAVAVLLVAVAVLVAFGQPKPQDKYVDSKRLQAVFLNTGQVYFGNIKALNSKYVVLKNIYYLQTSNSTGDSSSAASSSTTPKITLVKLGCELHEPLDQMVINSDQVTFWENLGNNGQVAQAVAKFVKAHPSGENNCTSDSGNSTTSGTSAQPAPASSSSSSSSAKP